jgi:23S rRNA (guanosine2251-2'-O)-methyltransferase
VAIGGRRPALEAVAARRAVRVVVAQNAGGSILDELRTAARRAGVPMAVAAAGALDRMGLGEHQGVVTFVRLPPPLDDRALAGRTFGPDALVVVLDGITDPHNLGACVRAAEAAGAEILVTRIHRAAALTPAAVKASAGALVHLEVSRVTNVTRSIELLKGRGFTVVGLDADGAGTIHDQPPRRPLAVVVGSEGAGLSRLVRTSCDLLVRIPMAGNVGSLNAAAALAVALFAYAARAEE